MGGAIAVQVNDGATGEAPQALWVWLPPLGSLIEALLTVGRISRSAERVNATDRHVASPEQQEDVDHMT